MKTLSLSAQLATVFAIVLLAAHAAFAQVPSAGTRTGINAAFVKLFGTNSAFTAKVDTRVVDPYQTELVRMPMDFAALDSKVRLEIDLAQVQGKDSSPGTVAALKQAGMDRMVTVFRPDKRATYIIYPGVQSYQNMAMAKGEAEAFEKGLKLEKTVLGKETIDGHACVKNKVIISGEKGSVLEATTWNATDLKDFPLQVQMKERGNTMLMRFTQVRFVKPDASQFELPANYGQMK